ncbi:MAG TPA: tRNA epoxyqueuosine(34) reductase QueG, partial [Gemmatales bacterium]|nr:tRNA epoxyqueuosine(34) reductase QueG [Gemmatales bacterium]
MSLAARLKQHARSLGFDLIGITDAAPPQTLEHFQAWLAAGHAAEMAYLHRHTEVRAQPNLLLENARSLVFTVLNYGRADPRPSGMGRVASYAQRADYHRVMWDMLDELGSWLRAQVPGCRTGSVVDSAPLLERDLARRAGLGWFGKNTMLLHPELGSMFFIGCLLTTAELPADPPFATDHCGPCPACLDACPTAAFPEPGVLDAGRCISYLTIELKGPVPTALRPIMGDWVFGC